MNNSTSLLRILAALGAALAAVIIAFAPGPAHAQKADKAHSKAVMLVAKPTLAAAYSQTVLLVVPLGETDEHVGFILNRPLEQKLGTIFPDHPASQKVVDPVRFGGPVMADTIFAMVRSQRGAPEGNAQPIVGDLFIASRATDIDRIIERTPNDARYFVGFVGWRPGELDAEIAKGFWYVIDPEPDIVFRKDQRAVWKELVHKLGIEPNPAQRAL